MDDRMMSTRQRSARHLRLAQNSEYINMVTAREYGNNGPTLIV